MVVCITKEHVDWFIPTVCAKWAAILLALLSYMVAEFSSAEHKYSVKPDCGNASCLGEACHELTFYAEHSSEFFQSHTVFLFLPGVHSPKLQYYIHIDSVTNLMLLGSDNGKRNSVHWKDRATLQIHNCCFSKLLG